VWLETDLLAGRMGSVLYIHFQCKLCWLTPDCFQKIIETFRLRMASAAPIDIIRTEYLEHCWIERQAFERWCTRWGVASPQIMPTLLAEKRLPTLKEAIRTRLNYQTPGKTLLWKKWFDAIRTDCGKTAYDHGFGDKNIDVQTRKIMRSLTH
jgi:hypothetical protein